MAHPTTSQSGQPPPISWILDAVLVPVIERGLEKGKIERQKRGGSDADLIKDIVAIFIWQLKAIEEEAPLSIARLAGSMGVPTAKVRQILEQITDWRWMADNIRLQQSDRGHLPLDDSVLILKSSSVDGRGINIFGTASRVIPNVVIDELLDEQLPTPANPGNKNSATDNSAILIEVGENYALPLRIEPLPERTKFDPRRYEPDLQRHVARALNNFHGPHKVSTEEVVIDNMINPLFETARELGHTSTKAVLESGCLQLEHLGRHTFFAGEKLDIALAAAQHGAKVFFDLPRRQRKGSRTSSCFECWDGGVKLGGEDCIFDVPGYGELSSQLMSYASHAPFRQATGSHGVDSVFLLVPDNVVELAGGDPGSVRFAVARAYVGPIGGPADKRVEASFLIRDHLGDVKSGWGMLGVDIRDEVVQVEEIERAELHLATMARDGVFHTTMQRMHGLGAQHTSSRKLPRLLENHGLLICAEILRTRAGIGL